MMPQPEFILSQWGVYGFKIGDAWLAGMPFPSDNEVFWQDLSGAGFDQVLCLTHDEAPYGPAPLDLLASKRLDDLDGEMVPKNPDSEKQQIYRLVDRVIESLKRGKSVVCHCQGGTGRTGTIMAATLMVLGFKWSEVLEAMTQVNKLRGKFPKGWPDAQWQKDLVKNWNI